jgi:peptidoglycan-associated lipoprotein
MKKTITALLLAAALLVGCHPTVKPVVKVAPAPAPVVVHVEVVKPAPKPAPAPVVVHVAPDILTLCKITDSKVGKTPLFKFDSAASSKDDQRLLSEVAKCVSKGPLKGRTLRLVGHTDPSGSDKYNIALGHRRANAVKFFVHRHGAAIKQLVESSRGKADAKGHDEAGWAKDRRVDVELVK